MLYSTSREQIWHKGATSGDVLDLVEVAVNCEQNSLIYKVRKAGTGVCHTKDEAARPSDLLLPGGRGRGDAPLHPMRICPDFDEFAALAADHTVVPVWPRSWRISPPVAAFARVVGDDEGFLLESVDNGDRWSRWSFIGRRPQGTLVSKGGRLQVIGDLGIDIDPEEGMLTALERLLATIGRPNSTICRRCTAV